MSKEQFAKAEKLPMVIVLDNVRSLHNVGSVFRTADAFSIVKIMLCGITAKPPHREINKTALGATETVDWEYWTETSSAIDSLRASGHVIVGVEQVAESTMLDKQSFNSEQKLALIFGNEVRGVDQQVLDMCDHHLEIPQTGTKHSLNISVSVGVVLWELVRNSLA